MLLWLVGSALASAPTGPTCAGPEAHGLDDRAIVLSGEVQTLDVDRFRLHWTDSGSDAVTSDADESGTPDLVELVADALTDARSRYVDQGWRPLVGDDGTGGSDAIDVYFVDIAANGYANATTPADGEAGHSCYMRLDPGIGGLGSEVIAASVAAHELHHCVQYRYTDRAVSWVYEGQATLEQYRHIGGPVTDIALATLWFKRLDEPDRPLDDTGDRFEYASLVWFKFWEESVGQPLPDLWEALAVESDWRLTFDGEAESLGRGDLGDAFLEHAIWNAFACGRDDGEHYLPTGAGCPEISRAEVAITPLPRPASFSVDLDGAFVSAYYELPHDGSETFVRLTCTGDADNGDLGFAVIDVGSGEVAMGRVAGPEQLFIDGGVTTGDSTLLVVTSNSERGATAQCTPTRIDPGQRSSSPCSTSASTATWAGLLVLPLWWWRRR